MNTKTPKELAEEAIEYYYKITHKGNDSFDGNVCRARKLALNEQMKMLSVCPKYITTIYGDYENPTYTQIQETINYLENLLK